MRICLYQNPSLAMSQRNSKRSRCHNHAFSTPYKTVLQYGWKLPISLGHAHVTHYILLLLHHVLCYSLPIRYTDLFPYRHLQVEKAVFGKERPTFLHFALVVLKISLHFNGCVIPIHRFKITSIYAQEFTMPFK